MTALFTPEIPERDGGEVAPGATLVPDWLTREQQKWIVDQFREWVRGPLFVFCGPARLAYHGVTKVHESTASEGCGLSRGRINITMRVTGLDG
ncbi:hypothetical protein GCM10022224_102810 [Nonomuraea antimicrobica]|uniref:Alpha-ketoglutarate-dependent dioxygenase AlkB-like domain-containing protein n=1 Tax=Nonomuraea antimicrobica TaxID=561173 RepID=A0ABP7ELC9_9ACTN